ncbi:hypothetical protein ACFMJX_26545, partial [Acinetobacter baumannii]
VGLTCADFFFLNLDALILNTSNSHPIVCGCAVLPKPLILVLAVIPILLIVAPTFNIGCFR